MDDRVTLGRMQNPVRGILHGTAAIASIFGVIVLVLAGSSTPSRIALGSFGVALVFLFTVSSLYHSVPWQEKHKRIMQRLDHSAIFVLIAGSYTAVAGIPLEGWAKWATLAAVWAVGLFGIAHNVFFPRPSQALSIALLLAMGWLGVAAAPPLARSIGGPAFGLLLLGGLLYTIGTIVMVTGRPRLWPRVFSSHELFHLFVVGAAALHFVVAVRYVAPLAGA
ncbi:MAG: hemolysin III family protein [Acidimicrobiia bacterium]|nr:hemolysin III family protein [Acidimicrobiia bacterium]